MNRAEKKMTPRYHILFVHMKHIARICLFIATLILGGSILLAPLAYGSDQTFIGKFVCYLKRPVMLPVAADIISLNVQPGQKVKEGENLGRYHITPEAQASLRERLMTIQINDMRSRMAEIDNGLNTLENKKDTVIQLSKQNLAPLHMLKQVNEEIQKLRKQRALLTDGLGQVERGNKCVETLLRKQLGVPIKPGHVPQEGVLVAPIDGHVLWMHPDLRPGALINGGTPVMMIGVMNPMLLRALVYESDALKLKVGEEAVITLESLPGRKFTARVSRLPWAPPAVSLEHPTYYEVEFQVANPDLILKEGMKATVTMPQSKGKPLPGSPQEKDPSPITSPPGKQ
jgi:multidrug resistance efflux pump